MIKIRCSCVMYCMILQELLDLTYQNSCLRGDIEKIKEEIRRLQHWLSCHPCIRPQGGAIGSNTHGEGLGENTVLISNSNEEELVGVLGGYETYNLTSIWQHGAGEEGTSSCIKPNLGAPYSITLNPTWSPVPCVGTSTAETAVDWETLSSCMFQGQSDQ